MPDPSDDLLAVAWQLRSRRRLWPETLSPLERLQVEHLGAMAATWSRAGASAVLLEHGEHV